MLPGVTVFRLDGGSRAPMDGFTACHDREHRTLRQATDTTGVRRVAQNSRGRSVVFAGVTVIRQDGGCRAPMDGFTACHASAHRAPAPAQIQQIIN
ncbi:MAG: hypothetical protein A3H44_00570 [Gammaproteobacteria bacterium RIFCSPLOWO2_02_FULL_57_10]|nr:MAG: hypothetical protein A3H44_00570 [Gammaproteobacteria bacterium RIFCSPLOWO2_02_FULL_57_10]